jgi:hypothetical protein
MDAPVSTSPLKRKLDQITLSGEVTLVCDVCYKQIRSYCASSSDSEIGGSGAGGTNSSGVRRPHTPSNCRLCVVYAHCGLYMYVSLCDVCVNVVE